MSSWELSEELNNFRKTISDKYNTLPYETRRLSAIQDCYLRIQCLLFEKKRLQKRYRQSMKEINDYLNAIKKDLIAYEKEITESEE